MIYLIDNIHIFGKALLLILINLEKTITTYITNLEKTITTCIN